MRIEDISPDRRQYLVRLEDRPHINALLAPPTPRNIPHGGRYLAQYRDAGSAIRRLEQALVGMPNRDLLTRTLARREAVQSSQIEGTYADLPQLLTYEATNGLDGLPPDVRTTERYVEGLQLGLSTVRNEDGGRAALTLGLINRLHEILMRDDPRDFPRGAYRTTQAWIAGHRIEDAKFVPAPAAAVPELMQEMEHSILQYQPREEEQGILSIFAQIAIAHVQFETIHPYHDGNGRTGRMLMPLMLAAEGYPPLYLSGTLLRNQQGYYDALASVQLRGDWEQWISMLTNAVVEASDDAISIAEDLNRIQLAWSGLLGAYRSDSATKRLPQLLIGHPVISVKQAAEELKVTRAAANIALNNLAAMGIVQVPNETKNWGRVFHATEILNRLAQPPAPRRQIPPN